jgi:hypothetical protein
MQQWGAIISRPVNFFGIQENRFVSAVMAWPLLTSDTTKKGKR